MLQRVGAKGRDEHEESMSPERARRILVVEDDADISALLRARFEQEGFEVTEASDAASVEWALAQGPIDLVTLDIGLERESGFALLRTIRGIGGAPVIMISGKCEEIDRVLGLELGADDYITKPFSLREVVARVHAVIRRAATPPPSPERAGGAEGDILSFEGGVLDCQKRTFQAASGEAVPLTAAEFNLLVLFLRNPQRVLTRDAIMNALKGHDWSVFDRSVDAAIARLRKKCEPDPSEPRYIKTVRGAGYVLAAKVARKSR
jgi:two-component system OmpR family response regulator